MTLTSKLGPVEIRQAAEATTIVNNWLAADAAIREYADISEEYWDSLTNRQRAEIRTEYIKAAVSEQTPVAPHEDPGFTVDDLLAIRAALIDAQGHNTCFNLRPVIAKVECLIRQVGK